MLRSRRVGSLLLVSICIIAFGLLFRSSLHPGSETPKQFYTRAASTNNTKCGYPGNSDIYGLGIRIGIYLQWFATWLATAFVPEEMLGTTVANSIFLIAIAVATLILCGSGSDTPVADMVIMLTIFAVSVYFLYSVSWMGRHFGPSSTRKFDFEDSSAVGEFIKAVLAMCMASITIWFWFRGLYDFKPTPCGTFTFVFAKLDVYGRVRIFYRVLSCISLFICVWFTSAPMVFLLAFPATGIYLIWRGKSMYDVCDFYRKHLLPWVLDRVNSFTEYARANRQTSEANARVFRWSFAAADVAVFALAIANIELTIHWNSIAGVYDAKATGQIIPLVIGIGGILNILWSAVYEPLKAWTEPTSAKDQDIRALLWPTYDSTRAVARLDSTYRRDRNPNGGPRFNRHRPGLIQRWPRPEFAGLTVPRRQSLDSIHVAGFKDDMSTTSTSHGVKIVWKAAYETKKGGSDGKGRIGRVGLIPALREAIKGDI